ncbi:radical SAM protein [bacterium]|nr:radical SAM protein [bacterium]
MIFNAIINSDRPLVIPIFLPHAGCPFQCAFCNQHLITDGANDELHQIDSIVAQYLGWSKKRKTREISFFGGSFTLLPRTLMQKAADDAIKWIEKGDIDSLRCSTRPDAVDNETIKWLQNNKFTTVELGAQSLSDNLLKDMNRGHTAQTVAEATERLKNAGIYTVLQFITGYPGESEDDITLTAQKLKSIAPDAIRIYPFIPLEKTEIFNKIAAKTRELLPVKTVIKHSAHLFVAAQLAAIPTIRIGLPEDGIKSPYPGNISQVVIAEGLKLLRRQGYTKYNLPKSWDTSLQISLRKE